MTYQEIETAANTPNGSYVNTDGDWCMTRTPEELRDYLTPIVPYSVVEIGKTNTCTAFVVFENGLKATWNGYCVYVKQ